MNKLFVLFLTLFASGIFAQSSVEYKVTEHWTKWKYGEKLSKSEREGRTKFIQRVEIVENDIGKMVIISNKNNVDSFLVTETQILKYSRRNNGRILTIGASDVLSVEHLIVKTLYPKLEFTLIRSKVMEETKPVKLKANFGKCLNILSDRRNGDFFEFDFNVEACGNKTTIMPNQIWMRFKYSQTTSAGPGSYGITKIVNIVKKN